jgi:hypothetical protein
MHKRGKAMDDLMMRRAIWSAAAVTLVMLTAVVAQAPTATITNRDDRDHKISIIEGDVTKDHVLKPNDTLKDVCAKGCVLRLNDSDDDEYQLEPTDVVSIEDGMLYYDTNEGDVDPKKDEPKKDEPKKP